MNFETLQEEIKKINFLDEYNKIDFQKIKDFVLKDEKRACILHSMLIKFQIFVINFFFFDNYRCNWFYCIVSNGWLGK